MYFTLSRAAGVAALCGSALFADFKHDQTSRMTGGAMMGMMRAMSKFTKGAMDPVNSTLAVKGNQMVSQDPKRSTIFDLDKETITVIDREKREYSVTTFAEMRAFMDKTMKTLQTQTSGSPNMTIDVKDTGREEVFNGMKAKEYLLVTKVEMSDPQSGKKGDMNMEISTWLTSTLPGYDEMRAFQLKLGEKLAMNSGFAGPMMQPGMQKGMAEAAKKLAALEGVPVLQITRAIPTDPEQIKSMEAQQQAAANAPPAPSASDAATAAAEQAATSAISNKLGRAGGLAGLGGGLGGLRKKKTEEAPAAAPAATPAPGAAEGAPLKGSFSSEVSLIEMTVESKNFSNSGVDAAMFEIPAGFKLIKSQMQK